MTPADALIEIIDASRRPVTWLSRAHFAERFGEDAAIICRGVMCQLVRDGQRYGVIDLSGSKVTSWWINSVKTTAPLSASSAAWHVVYEGCPIRLGDGKEVQRANQ